MRSPTKRVLANRVNIFLATNSVDTDAGPQWPVGTSPTYKDVPCTAQIVGFDMMVDDQQRVMQIYEWKIMFGSFIALTPRDQIIYVDGGNTSHTLFFKAIRDNAERGAAFTIRAEERI